MTTIGIAVLMTGGAAVLFLLTSWRPPRGNLADLGTMSQQWRIQQRANERYDSQR